ncbi:DUF6795 domain-containing protein [Psychrobium sp. nBUS_13]|uniref:DUF6795 domain-containing protein n=1 Tax=Psychrobium sp. nBUS_13 TaxID=3395319 RepID=UPI003EC0DFAC
MTANNSGNAHLSPVVNGQLFRLDKPLSGIEIIRKLSYGNGQEIIDTVTTDRKGNFKFSEKTVKTSTLVTPYHESKSAQIILAKWRNVYHILWQTRPSSSQQDSNISKHLNELTCDITDTEETYVLPSDKYDNGKHLLYSICDIDGTRATLQYAWTL